MRSGACFRRPKLSDFGLLSRMVVSLRSNVAKKEPCQIPHTIFPHRLYL